MSEILFIAIDPVILSLVENLQQVVESQITLESDYTTGIKRVFDARPAIVFLQHRIGEMTCDKLANQIKMLLDAEASPLVLLSDEKATSYNVVSTYEACFDLCLPLDELSEQIQELLRTLPQIAWKEPAAPAPQSTDPTGSEMTLELTLPAGVADFSQPFPWREEGGDSTLSALEGNAIPLTGLGESSNPTATSPHLLPDFFEERFAIEPAPLVFDEIVEQEKPGPGAVPLFFDEIPEAKKLRGEPAPPAPPPLQDLHRIEREDPGQVFGSMSESRSEPPFAAPRKPVPAAVKGAAATRPGPAASSQKTGSGTPQKEQPADPVRSGPQAEFPAGELPEEVRAALGVSKKKPRYFRALAIGLVLVIGSVVALDLFSARHAAPPETPKGIGELDSALNHRPPPPAAPAPQLPQFIPQVVAEPGYTAAHPGWDRYQADGVEYLVYREAGILKAVQVLSKERGIITEPFLKTCIRLISGQDQFATKETEVRSGIKVVTGTMQNGGELQIYRAIPDGEIRGFVMTYPAQDGTK